MMRVWTPFVRSLPLERKKTRSPLAWLSGGQSPATARPVGFSQWWAWGVMQADAVVRMSRGGLWRGTLAASFAPKLETFSLARHHIPKGWRFAGEKGVEKKLPRRRTKVVTEAGAVTDAVTARVPMSAVMQGLANRRGSHPHEYRILFALVNGHTDPEVVRAIVGGCRREFFEAAAIRALSLVYERAQQELPTNGRL